MSDNKKPLYGAMLPRSELNELAYGVGKLSTHTLSQWVKAKTNGEYVVVPRKFVFAAIEYLDSDNDIEMVRNFL